MKSRRAPLKALLTGLLLSAAISTPALAAPSLEEVMAAPDDLALNLAFARSEANAGELLSAAGALERILLAQPNAHQARLFYAAVLYRLGDYQGARQQLNQLDNVELTPLQRAEKERYERSIAKRLARFEFTGQVAAGLAWQEDAGRAVNTVQEFFDPLIEAEEGTAQVYSGRVDALYKLRPEGEFAIYGSLAGYHQEQIDGPETEFQRGEMRFGVRHVGRMTAWNGGIVARKLRLFQEDYLTELGAEAALNKRINTATTVHLTGEAVSQEFDNEPPFLAFFGGFRDGSRAEVGVGVTHRFSSRSILSAALGYEWKEAQRDPWSYEAPSLRASYDHLFGRGVYASLSGQVRNVKYAEEDDFLFNFDTFEPTRREDQRTYARAALGAPISAFSREGATGDIREDLKIEGAVNYTGRETEPPLADFEGWGAELRLIWRFGR